MKQSKQNTTTRILLRDYHNYSFCRTTKQLYRNGFGSNVLIRKNDEGKFKIKKNSVPLDFTEFELMKLTEYAATNLEKGDKKRSNRKRVKIAVTLDTVLSFGKCIGKSIAEVIDDDIEYMTWCIDTMDYFEFDDESYSYYEKILGEA